MLARLRAILGLRSDRPRASSRYASAAAPVGSYLRTELPFTGASAYRTVFLIRVR